MPSTIPNNALQEARRKADLQAKRPNISGVNEARVLILKVYDREYLEVHGIPENLSRFLVVEPGTLWARVQLLRSGKELYVGFEAGESLIFSSYGNSVNIEGLEGIIRYKGLRPETGKLTITGKPKKALKDFKATNVFDISGIF